MSKCSWNLESLISGFQLGITMNIYDTFICSFIFPGEGCANKRLKKSVRSKLWDIISSMGPRSASDSISSGMYLMQLWQDLVGGHPCMVPKPPLDSEEQWLYSEALPDSQAHHPIKDRTAWNCSPASGPHTSRATVTLLPLTRSLQETWTSLPGARSFPSSDESIPLFSRREPWPQTCKFRIFIPAISHVHVGGPVQMVPREEHTPTLDTSSNHKQQ